MAEPPSGGGSLVKSDPSSIAERMSVPAALVRRLQWRGYLRRVDLDSAEIRLRLWRGYLGRRDLG